nr:HPr-rel-A system PqqD family peptide chaperone [Pacificimonas flava]
MTLVFHRLSGETHILSPEAEAILHAVPMGGADGPAVVETLSVDFDIVSADSPGPDETILARLQELADLGILQRCP